MGLFSFIGSVRDMAFSQLVASQFLGYCQMVKAGS
jgi:hypothetical protein